MASNVLEISNVRIPGILASEARDVSAAASANLDIVNRGAPRNLQFAGVSCGPCMTVYANDRPLSAGESQDLQQGQSWPLRVDIHTGGIVGERFQALYFREEGPEGAFDRVARVDYRIYPDVHVQPDVINHRFEAQGESTVERPIIVRWVRRGRDAAKVQLASGLGNFSIVQCIRSGDDEELEPGLWRSSWDVRLRIDRGTDDSISGVARPLNVQVIRETGELAGDAKLKTMLYTGCGIIAPKSVVLRPNRDTVAERAVLLRSEDDHKFRILDVKCNNDSFQVKSVGAAANYANSLHVLYRASNSGRIVAELSITTDHPRRPIVKLELIGEAAP
jgi:hypothetical protein